MAFTEYYANASTGSNVNAGSTAGSAAYTATNGAWVSGTGIFTPVTGDPSASVAVGDFVSIYTDGATTTGFVGRVTAVSSLTITVSLTAKSGTIPTTAATGISCKAGGAWLGPNGSVNFPFGWITAAMTDSAGDYPRVNLKNTSTYSVTAVVTHNVSGPVRFQGYTSTVGDGGKFTIDGGGANINIFTSSSTYAEYYDGIFSNVGVSAGSGQGFALSGNRQVAVRIVAHDVRGAGIYISSANNTLIEGEAYLCNKGNNSNSNQNGIYAGGENILLRRCISHDNAGSNSVGFGLDGGVILDHCIADTNGKYGAIIGDPGNVRIVNSDFYANVSDGLYLGNTSACTYYIENCNFIQNGGWGINGGGSGNRIGRITNCGFGAGTAANTSGTTTGLKSVEEIGSVNYASNVTPWNAPATGDFTVTLAAAKGAGRGAFTETQASYTGTAATEDIGAAHSAAAAAGGGGGILKSSIIHSSMS